MMGRGQGMWNKGNFTNALPAGFERDSLHFFFQSNLVLTYHSCPYLTPFTSIRLKKVLYKIYLHILNKGGIAYEMTVRISY